MDLGLEETLITLGAACQRRITLVDNRDEPERGVWYVLHRQGFVGAIPKRFRFKSALDAIPKSAGPLRYTAGVGMNLQLVQPDLAFGPHLLIAGSPGAGKSNHLNSILMQFLLRNSPDTLEIYMIDLKGGMELQDYENLPHVKRFVKEPEEVPDLLAQFSSELKTRETKFAAASVRDLAGWNRLHREKQLPRMLLVIDELAQVLLNLDKKLAKDAGIALVSTISVSRAPGGHAILCTQRPSSDIVLPVIKVNCPLRVAFRVPSHFDSAVILDQAGAEKLGQPGRAIMVNGPDVREMQTPLITPRMIRLGINKVGENGRKVVKGPDITIEDVARRALENYHGAVPARQIELDLRDRASSTQIRRAIEALDESPVEVDGITYQTIRRTNGHGGKEMRQLVPITNHQIPDFPQTGMITRRGRIVDLKGSRE
jgi:DNA segregation ATPase FtsK/SpoIIIE-like protein